MAQDICSSGNPEKQLTLDNMGTGGHTHAHTHTYYKPLFLHTHTHTHKALCDEIQVTSLIGSGGGVQTREYKWGGGALYHPCGKFVTLTFVISNPDW